MRGWENIVKIQFAIHDKLNEWQHFLVHLLFNKNFIFVCITLQFLIRPSLPKPPHSCVVCKSASNSASPRILSTSWATEQAKGCPRAHKPHRAHNHQLDLARMRSRTITELTDTLKPGIHCQFSITGEHILSSNIGFHLKCYFSLSFLCFRSNKDVICRRRKETELWAEMAEASCSFGADTDWYKYWS